MNDRIARLREVATGDMLVTGAANVRWLCGFTGSNGQLVLAGEDAVFFTDGRYTQQAGDEVHGCEVVTYERGRFYDELRRRFGESG